MFTIEQLRKMARVDTLYGNSGFSREETVVRYFMEELEYRQIRGVKKKSMNHYQDYVYYIAYNGRLARVPNTPKKPIGSRLIKNHTLYYDDYGLLRCDIDLGTTGAFVKHRGIIKELDPTGKWSRYVRDTIEKYLDGGKECTMVIDRDFKTAYDPEYHDDFCIDGDLVTGSSCMSDQGDCAQEFYGGIDGCNIVRFEDNGKQVGRCIMYEYNGQRHFIRIYAQRDYARCALRLLKHEMRENDLFGRSERINGLCLSTNWDDCTHTMYLDGEYYGYDVNKRVVVDTQTSTHDVDFKTTGNEELSEYYDDCGLRVCENCGEWFNPENGDYVRDENYNYYCCEDCAESAGLRKCMHCEHWYDPRDREGYETPDGDWFCCASCLRNEDYIICEHCKNVHYYEDAFEIDGNWYCDEDCAREDGWQQCDKCGDWHKDLIKNMNNGQFLCENCADEQGLKLAYVSEKQFNKTNKKEVNND